MHPGERTTKKVVASTHSPSFFLCFHFLNLFFIFNWSYELDYVTFFLKRSLYSYDMCQNLIKCNMANWCQHCP